MNVLVIFFVTLCGHLVRCLEPELRQHILDIHNDYRRNESNACQMNKLEYDMGLEAAAARWANGCIFKHEIVQGRGENLAWNSAHDNETDLMSNAAKRWYDEIYIYSYGQYSCGAACHYTQMVWDTTNKVGCATKRCPYLVNAYRDAWYLVCFYSPSGNMNGEKPYQKSCDTPCRKGQTEEDGLCVGIASGSGSGEECKDKESSCPEWASSNECTRNPNYMKKNCRKSCKICVSEEGEVEEGTGETTETGTETETKEPCVDKNTRCQSWANDDQCSRNPGYMLKNCRKACTECEPCVDKNSRCPSWADDGHCERNAGYMLKNCKKSCRVCGGTGEGETGGTGGGETGGTGGGETGGSGGGETGGTGGGETGGSNEENETKEPCVDKNNACPSWASDGHCERSARYMLKNCRKSCRVCGTETEETGKGETGGTGEGETSGGNEENESKGETTNCSGKSEEKKETKETTNEKKEKESVDCPVDHRKCAYWKKRHMCTTHQRYMERRCKRGCGWCTP